MAPVVGLGGIVIPPPPPGMSPHGLHQRDERLRRLGLTLHRMHMRALTAERHKAIKLSYPVAYDVPIEHNTYGNRLASVAPMKSSPERQERVQEYLRQRYSRPVSCTPAEIRSHYAGIFGSNNASVSHSAHFNELGVPREFPAFYGVCCRQSGIILDARDSSLSDAAPTGTLAEAPSVHGDVTPAASPRELSFEAIRQRCNEKIRARTRAFTPLTS